MRCSSISALTAVSIIALTHMASAADLPRKAPVAPPPPPVSWTGFYLGGHAGGLWTNADGTWTPGPTPADFGVNPISGDFNDTSFVGGVQVGYNWQFAPTWVVGIEGDWSWTNANKSFTSTWTEFAGPATFPGDTTTMTMNLKWLATLRGRIGYLVVPQALVYFTGGVAWGDVHYSAVAQNGPPTAAVPFYIAPTSFSDTSVGYVLGGGVEWMLASHWMLRGEYLFYHLNSAKSATAFDTTGTFPPPAVPSFFNWNDLQVNVVRAALSYKF
jgi:outer membrane immunogenic protein